MQLRHYSDDNQAKNLMWWEGTHAMIMTLIMLIMAAILIFNSVIVINFELTPDQSPIPHMWTWIIVGTIICIFEAIKARMCQYKLQDLRLPFPQPPEGKTEE